MKNNASLFSDVDSYGSCICRSAVASAERAGLIAPHGDKLVNLMLPADKKQASIDSCTKTVELSDRNACDVELLTVGYVAPSFSPPKSLLLFSLSLQ